MKTRIQVALFATLLSVTAHIYLTLHYYALKFGYASEQSICNINAKFNCDAVAASDYASLLGVPMSLWGMATNLVLFGLIVLGWLEWTKQPERVRRFAYALAALNLASSVVMGSISLLYLQTFCLVCIGLYVLSAITFATYATIPRGPRWSGLRSDLTTHFAESLPWLGSLGSIPVIAFVAHMMFANNAAEHQGGNINQIEQMVSGALAEWALSPRRDFVAKPSLVMGPSKESAKMTLVEFADFRCGHCKHASLTLDAFVKAHPDVRLEFYAFPLDGACNPEIKQANQISCRLAETVYCAEKDAGKGWDMHHALYAAQDDINGMSTSAQLDVVLSNTAGQLGLTWSSLQVCVESGATIDAMRAQSKQGALVAVRGTPTIFADGRLLEGGQMMPVLEAAYRSLKR